jgi:hypothetical protein
MEELRASQKIYDNAAETVARSELQKSGENAY